MRCELYFGVLRIGAVIDAHDDLQSPEGRILYDKSFLMSDAAARLRQFIALGHECSRLAGDSERFQEIVEEWNGPLSDLTYSGVWSLFGDEGERGILAPTFLHTGRIYWRWRDSA